MTPSGKANTVAIVVGIDHYEFRDQRSLTTPTADALRFVDWLKVANGSMDGVELFLSPRSWTEPHVEDWIARQGWSGARRPATHDGISQFFNKELPGLYPETIVVFWGGHGFVDDHNCQFVYTADASEDAPYCVNVDTMVRSLARNHFRELRQRVCIVDACAEAYLPGADCYLPIPLAAHFNADSQVDHIGAYAAAPGRTSRGALAKALLVKLEPQQTAGLPDFAALLTDLVKNPGKGSLGKQGSYLKLITPKEQILFQTPQALQIAGAVLAIEQTSISQAQLYRLFARSMPKSADAAELPATPGKALRRLRDNNPRTPGGPGPMEEFMVRLAREFPHEAVTAWIDEHVSPMARSRIEALLDRESTDGGDGYARLFIEVDAEQRNVRWFVQHADASHYSQVYHWDCNPAVAEESLSSLLPKIIHHVDTMPIEVRRRLLVGLLLPGKLLAHGVESTRIPYEDDDLGDGSTPLLQRYPVVLHWQRRAGLGRPGKVQPLEKWRQILDALKSQRIDVNRAAIKWIDRGGDAAGLVAGAFDQLCDPSSVELCIGFACPSDGSQAQLLDTIKHCLERGIPYFSWISTALPDPTPLQHAADVEFACHAPARMPYAMAEYIMRCAEGNHPAQALRVVWDDDRMLPAQGRFSIPKDHP